MRYYCQMGHRNSPALCCAVKMMLVSWGLVDGFPGFSKRSGGGWDNLPLMSELSPEIKTTDKICFYLFHSRRPSWKLLHFLFLLFFHIVNCLPAERMEFLWGGSRGPPWDAAWDFCLCSRSGYPRLSPPSLPTPTPPRNTHTHTSITH